MSKGQSAKYDDAKQRINSERGLTKSGTTGRWTKRTDPQQSEYLGVRPKLTTSSEAKTQKSKRKKKKTRAKVGGRPEDYKRQTGGVGGGNTEDLVGKKAK